MEEVSYRVAHRSPPGRALELHARAQEVVARPIVLVLALFGALIVFTQGSALAPFVYTLF